MIWDGLLLPFVVEPVKHAKRLATDRNYRAYSFLATRMAGTPRYTRRTVRVQGREIAVPDVASFLSTYRELFVEQMYRFEFPGPAPRILDLGANIGLSVLYFKELFPEARITAYEAEPAIFAYLEQNVRAQGLSGVKLVQGAVWHEDGELSFHAEGSDGGRIASDGKPGNVSVPAFDIRGILAAEAFDVLKMDIEGAEASVMEACRGLLDGFRYVFVEFHSAPGSPQRLHAILDVLSQAGFRYYLEGVHNIPSPFYHLPVYGGFDLQLNIFAWRDQSC